MDFWVWDPIAHRYVVWVCLRILFGLEVLPHYKKTTCWQVEFSRWVSTRKKTIKWEELDLNLLGYRVFKAWKIPFLGDVDPAPILVEKYFRDINNHLGTIHVFGFQHFVLNKIDPRKKIMKLEVFPGKKIPWEAKRSRKKLEMFQPHKDDQTGFHAFGFCSNAQQLRCFGVIATEALLKSWPSQLPPSKLPPPEIRFWY